MTQHHQCLNCGHKLDNKFCPACGQKADTHRITVKHFILHDLAHGVWHLDKGILYTLKETLIRPGYAALDYIRGKRIRYYNIFYLLLLITGLNIIILHYAETLHPIQSQIRTEGDGSRIAEFVDKNRKYILFSFIPLFAFNSLLFFRRLKLNYAEHHIIAGFVLLTISCLQVLRCLIKLFPTSVSENFLLGGLNSILSVLISCVPAIVYFQAMRAHYKFFSFLWRIVSMYILFAIEVAIVIFLAILILSKGRFDGAFLL